jgi:hypothetical protein
MPRAVDENKNYIPFELCTRISRLGKLSEFSETPGEELNHFVSELGSGVTLYFKLLRYIGLMFLFFTILSIPTFVVYGIHGQTNDLDSLEKGTNFAAKLSIGNVGSSMRYCMTFEDDQDLNAVKYLTCPYGVV